MQKEVEDILKSSIDNKELCLKSYYKVCDVYCIDSNRNCYQLEHNTEINFEIASIAIIQGNLLCMFVTNPKFRRQGFGKNLLRCVCEIYNNLKLNVRISNEPAINLYKSMGFVITIKIPNYYSYTNRPEDAYEMIR